MIRTTTWKAGRHRRPWGCVHWKYWSLLLFPITKRESPTRKVKTIKKHPGRNWFFSAGNEIIGETQVEQGDLSSTFSLTKLRNVSATSNTTILPTLKPKFDKKHLNENIIKNNFAQYCKWFVSVRVWYYKLCLLTNYFSDLIDFDCFSIAISTCLQIPKVTCSLKWSRSNLGDVLNLACA